MINILTEAVTVPLMRLYSIATRLLEQRNRAFKGGGDLFTASLRGIRVCAQFNCHGSAKDPYQIVNGTAIVLKVFYCMYLNNLQFYWKALWVKWC